MQCYNNLISGTKNWLLFLLLFSFGEVSYKAGFLPLPCPVPEKRKRKKKKCSPRCPVSWPMHRLWKKRKRKKMNDNNNSRDLIVQNVQTVCVQCKTTPVALWENLRFFSVHYHLSPFKPTLLFAFTNCCKCNGSNCDD